MDESPHLTLARRLAGLFSAFPAVEAIGLAGSQASGAGDSASDIDLYVYTSATLPLAARQAIVDSGGASRADLDLNLWDPGDEWFDAGTGIEVDVIYWDPAWITAQIERVLERHEASLGYTTCFWHTIRQAQILYDRRGWLAALQAKASQPYPEALRRAIIAKNHPVLRSIIPAYSHQIEKAIRRRDLVSLNHRVAALLASYFDILFALNRLPNPGEKRLLDFAAGRCEKVPRGMAAEVEEVLRASGSADMALMLKLNSLLDHLDALLRAEGFQV